MGKGSSGRSRQIEQLQPEGAPRSAHSKADNRRCAMCGQTGDWHAANHTEHDFEPEDAPPAPRGKPDPLENSAQRREREGKEAARAASVRSLAQSAQYRQRSVPTDPALRLLLVQKGVIGPEDLAGADKLLESLTGSGSVVRASPGQDQLMVDGRPLDERGTE